MAAVALAFSAREHRCGVRQPGGKGSVVLPNHFDPCSPYSASKAASDHLAQAWQHTYGLPVLVSNCSNNYEPYHYPEKLIPRTLVNILRGQPIPVFGDGQNVHDWLYVEDHCPALDRILSQGEPGSTNSIGGRNEVANIDLVTMLCALMDGLALRPGCTCR